MPKRCVANVVTKGNCACKFRVKAKVFCGCSGNAFHVVNVFHSGADVVVVGGIKNLGLVLKPAV